MIDLSSATELNTTCVSCGGTFHVDAAHLGHVVRCPHCHKIVPTKLAQMNSYLASSGDHGVMVEGRVIGDSDGYFQSVAGESHHQDVLQAIKHDAPRPAGQVEFTAFLRPERNNPYDANAIGVFDREHGQVGYLPREDAARFRPIADRLLARGRCIACPARLTGGTADKPYIGVTLSLPPADEVESMEDDLLSGE